MSEPGTLELGQRQVQIHDEADIGALIALAGLPGLAPRRFWSLLDLGRPLDVWRRVCAGGAPRHGRGVDAAANWPRWSSSIDPEAERIRHERAGVRILPFGCHGYPDALLDDPEPPAVMFRQGPAELDDRVRVGVVGTRLCTPYGREMARDLGAELARRGVDVVSGLASGIDAAAHAGTISQDPTRTVAVVAGGVDVIYPKSNRGLYTAVSTHGALLSEWPLGATPERWRFPARNRLVAALSAAVVVIESREKGGSMYTVDEALARDRAVFAMPGSIKSPVSAGTNKLIAEGAYSLHNIDQFLDMIAPLRGPKPEQTAIGIDSWLLEAIGWEPVDLDAVVVESGRSPGEVILEVERLIGDGAIRRLGGVVERVS